MKCPKCGFVSFPGLRRCRKCGFPLNPPSGLSAEVLPGGDDVEGAASSDSQFVSSSSELSPTVDSEVEQSWKPRGMPGTPRPLAGNAAPAELPVQPGKTSPPQPEWASEISDRVAQFRQRREATPQALERDFSLPFNRGMGAQKEIPASGRVWGEAPEPKRLNLDIAFGGRGDYDSSRNIESLPLNPPTPPPPANGPEPLAVSWAKTQTEPALALESDFSETNPIPASDFAEVLSAPLGVRFLAGLLDVLVLLAAACVFAGLFALVVRISGGHVLAQLAPLSLGVLLALGAFWLFTYFAAFTLLTLSTPGQAMMGLWVRNFDGGIPTRQECLLRAFGYLVSIASVMLGFLWAAMDSDGLAWHDHISGTLLTEADFVWRP